MLAATLTTPTKGQSIPQVLDQAILIREESIAARTRRREALIKAAPWEALNHARSWRIEEAPEFINDPIFHQLGDVIKQKLLEIYGEGDARRAAELRERIGLPMEKCKTRAGRPAPSLPATAKEVLLWVANALPKHWPAVEAAFLDFLTLCGCRTNHDLYDQRANAEERAKMRADFLKSHGSLEALTEEMRSRLEGYAADAADVDFCDNFTPGKKACLRTRKTSETTYQEH
ncbi:MAG: hypothetical protein ACKV19_20845, partial [Verrucomicrobiales bacterium]